MARILVVVAHPDDEVLGCGGTLPLLTCAGHEATIAILGEGIASRFDLRDSAGTAELDALRRDAQSVAALLGARQLIMEKFPDNRFDSLPLLDVVKVVERLVQTLRPEIVFTHHGGDLNVDHGVVHRAVLTATRPQDGMPVREISGCEVASSTEWAFQQIAPPFRPNVFENIGETLAVKQQAMQAYRSEARAYPHPRSPEAIEATASRWGSVVGCRAAEAFELIRSIRSSPWL
ncbi:MAG: PIG-L deacetylase family protein [Bryobacteraceae bacterium]